MYLVYSWEKNAYQQRVGKETSQTLRTKKQTALASAATHQGPLVLPIKV
jgi:hypothetical protein